MMPPLGKPRTPERRPPAAGNSQQKIRPLKTCLLGPRRGQGSREAGRSAWREGPWVAESFRNKAISPFSWPVRATHRHPFVWFAGLRIPAFGFPVPCASWPGGRAVSQLRPLPKLNCPQMACGALGPLQRSADFPRVRDSLSPGQVLVVEPWAARWSPGGAGRRQPLRLSPQCGSQRSCLVAAAGDPGALEDPAGWRGWATATELPAQPSPQQPLSPAPSLRKPVS